jgi:hypothetical protein
MSGGDGEYRTSPYTRSVWQMESGGFRTSPYTRKIWQQLSDGFRTAVSEGWPTLLDFIFNRKSYN